MKSKGVSVAVGLSVAWGGPLLLLSPADRLLGPQDSMLTKVLEQLVLWALMAIILAIVVYWEKQPPASMGFRPFRWSSIGWGLALAASMIYVVIPFLTWLLHVMGIPAFEAGMAKILAVPIGIRALAAVTAGVVEDTLFVGYAFTRLELVTRRTWLAGAISVAVSALLHLPHWGIGPVLAYLVTGALHVAFFAWRRDLLANIVAHATVDSMGLVVMPLRALW